MSPLSPLEAPLPHPAGLVVNQLLGPQHLGTLCKLCSLSLVLIFRKHL